MNINGPSPTQTSLRIGGTITNLVTKFDVNTRTSRFKFRLRAGKPVLAVLQCTCYSASSDFLKSGILWWKNPSLHVTKYDGSAARFLSGSSAAATLERSAVHTGSHMHRDRLEGYLVLVISSDTAAKTSGCLVHSV